MTLNLKTEYGKIIFINPAKKADKAVKVLIVQWSHNYRRNDEKQDK